MRRFDTPSWKWHDLTTKPFRPIESTLSDDEKEDMSDKSKDDGPVSPEYHFPDLDKHIRGCIEEYGAVFPKLNFSSPKVSEDNLLSKTDVNDSYRMRRGYSRLLPPSSAHPPQTCICY